MFFVQANTMKTVDDIQQINVRKWQYDDAAALFALGRNRNMRNSWHYSYPYTQRKAEDCIQFFLHANPHRYAIYAVVINDQLCGWIQAKSVEHQCAELTYWLKYDNPDTSTLKAILKQMIPLAFEHLDILTLYMKTAMEETALRRALIQLGFVENNETVPIYLYYLHSCMIASLTHTYDIYKHKAV